MMSNHRDERNVVNDWALYCELAENEQYDEIDRLEEEVQLDSYNSYLRSMQEEYDDGE